MVATLTEPHTRSVAASASGIESMRMRSPEVKPLCTSAEKPPMKSMLSFFAALSSVFAMQTAPLMASLSLSPQRRVQQLAMGVTEMRLLTMGMPNFASTLSPRRRAGRRGS